MLKEVGLVVLDIFEVIGFLEIMDGCVKMLYLVVYGGLFVIWDDVGY